MTIYLLLIIILIILAFIYKFYKNKNDLLQFSEELVNLLIQRDKYLYIRIKSALQLPTHYRKQINKLLNNNLKDYVDDIPEAKILLLFKKDVLIGLLMTYKVGEHPTVLQRVLKKANVKENLTYIGSVNIHKDYRNMGYGTKLLNILLEIINESCILEVKKNNKIAIKLYDNLGFQIIGEDKNSYLMGIKYNLL